MIEPCVDLDNGVTDRFGDGCSYYRQDPDDCGSGDDDDFTASELCCACKGIYNEMYLHIILLCYTI